MPPRGGHPFKDDSTNEAFERAFDALVAQRTRYANDPSLTVAETEVRCLAVNACIDALRAAFGLTS